MDHSRRYFLEKGAALVSGLIAGTYFQSMAGGLLETTKTVRHPTTKLPVINSGVGGNNTIDLLNRIRKDCLIHKPKLTILMAGTNDMNSVKYVPINQYEKNLATIADSIVSGGSRLLMLTILPAYEPYLLTRHRASFYEPEGVEGRRKQVNDIIRKVAGMYKTHILDMEQRFLAVGKIGTDKDSLIQNEANSNKTDGIHPTPNGYRFMALCIYDYILYNNLPKEDIVCFGDSITKGDGTNTSGSYPGYLNKLLTTT
ncbi:GDSL-type esterase/lipase family protein [Haoranjiania flava]|uniref:GDSL-type esterase/lipase family protein n=1 Tax=Haoranjiania flava TaxID=1856322 RepID=A0AAE3IL64_9BACT|nr:GDSL-type esterase/lipase family protein [Haoranjiania flava]MCU7693203.1 GDSL-type esterase/lipase family protein [Haoranjiania flava]